MSHATKPRVVITETLADDAVAWLNRRAEVVWCSVEKPKALRQTLAEAQAVIVRTYTQVDQALLDQAPRLKVVGRAGVGLDNIDVPACRARGVEVVHTPEANTQAVVEYVLGLMLAEVRPRTTLTLNRAGGITPIRSAPASSFAAADAPAPQANHDPAATFHQLRKTEIGRQLDQFTLGIVGFGRIGKRLGHAAHALGMNLVTCDLLPEVELRKVVSYPFSYVDPHTLYRQSDIVTIHTDGRRANRHLIDAAALSHFKSDTIFINAARGMLVDAAALAAWARSHPAGRAILDVHDPEPPPTHATATADAYPLWNLPNVRLLPHLASRTDQALTNMSGVVHDVAAVLAGQPPTHPAPWKLLGTY